jgi:hypothetical protein
MPISVVAATRAAEPTRPDDLCLSEDLASQPSGAGPFNRTERAFEAARPDLVLRAAKRYWLLRFAGDELRFTHRISAELWATKLAARGIASQLTRHDETTPADHEDERRVA